MSDIANHMGISKRTLYEVFKDKEELLDVCIMRNLERGEKEMMEFIESSENVLDAMLRIYIKNSKDINKINKSAIYDLKKYHPKQYEKITCKHSVGPEPFLPLFQKALDQGLIRDDINFEILLWLLKAQFKMVMEGDFLPSDKYSLAEFSEAIILSFVRGIATPKGCEKIEEIVGKYKQQNK
jgi:Transcriptional regulator